jgi:hypothetical protein
VKVETLSIKILERDKTALRALAQRDEVSMALVVRRLIKAAVAEAVKSTPAPESPKPEGGAR